MIYLLLLLLLGYIIYRLYRVFGQRDAGISIKVIRSPEELRKILEQQDDLETNDAMPMREILRPQWNALKELDTKADEKVMCKRFVELFKGVYMAFSTGNITPIENNISPTVKEAIQQAIESRGAYTLEHTFEQEPVCEIKAIHIQDTICSVEVELKSTQIIVNKDQTGETDNPANIAEDIDDHWIFQRNYNNPKSDWIVMDII